MRPLILAMLAPAALAGCAVGGEGGSDGPGVELDAGGDAADASHEVVDTPQHDAYPTCLDAGLASPGACSGACTPCEQKTEGCGHCGTRVSFCDPVTCTWVLGACEASRDCDPGSWHLEAAGCSAGSYRLSVCDATCHFGVAGTCADAPAWHDTPAPPTTLAERAFASTVFTGTEVLVWGGQDATGFSQRGARWNPTTHAWAAMATPDGSDLATRPFVKARNGQLAAWTGSEMVVFGGVGDLGPLGDGALYDPVADAWRAAKFPGPGARVQHAAAWTGTRFVVWGGKVAGVPGVADSGASYDPVGDTWSSIAPSPIGGRTDATLVADPATGVVYVWGGSDGHAAQATGARYDPATDGWAPIAASPTGGRKKHQAFWDATRHVMIVWGGEGDLLDDHDDGAVYDPATDAWTAFGGAADHVGVFFGFGASALVADGKLWVIGGESSTGEVLAATARFDATLGVWTRMPDLSHARSSASVAWTGAPFAWGGFDATFALEATGETLDGLP